MIKFDDFKKLDIKMISFDMDGVLIDVADYNEDNKEIAVSTWNAVFEQIGIYHEHKRFKEMFIQGKFPSYLEWTAEACRVLQKNGLTKEKFIEIINNRPLMNGAKETLDELKNRGYKTVVITGSFQALAERVKKEVGLDFIISHCDLVFDEKRFKRNLEIFPKNMTDILAYLASIAGIAMSLANYPQAYKIYKTKSAGDISILTYLILVSGGIIWLLYGINIKNLPVIITYSFGTFSSLLVLIGILRYRN